MNDNLALEKKILEQKRKDILNEVEQKKRYQEEIQKKLISVTKEAKGSYSQEKENTEKKLSDKDKLLRRLIFSCIFTIPLLIVTMGHMVGMPLPKK